MTLFRPAKQNRIFEDVVEQIQEAILSGQIKDGDRLPPERELREMLQTSRSTIREALRVLEQKGLIEIRLGTGGGAMVKAVSSETITESLALLIASRSISLKHLYEFRERVEGDVAVLATERCTPEHITNLRQLLKEAHAEVQKGPEAARDFLHIDREIHFYLSQITNNPIYIIILKTVHNNIQRYFDQYLAMDQERLDENYNDLVRIVDCLEKGDGEQARQLAQTHVRRFGYYMGNRNFSEIKWERESGPGTFVS